MTSYRALPSFIGLTCERCGLIVVEDLERIGHEAEEENQKGKEGAKLASGIERLEFARWSNAEKAKTEEEDSPDIPPGPMEKQAESEQKEGKEKREQTMDPNTDGTEDVAAIELACGKKVQRSGKETDPSGASYRMKQERRGRRARMKRAGK
jgi:hypothetical protein